MANHDRVSERYYGTVNAEASHEATRARIHWMCRQATGQRILDVGCSQGIASILLGREGFRVTGIDLEDESIRYAREELAKESRPVRSKVDFLLADITQWRVRTVFDTVLLGEVLEHFSHPEVLLMQLHRLLRIDGTLVVTVPYGYHPFHDHKQTFYAGNLATCLMPYFDVYKIEIHHKYLCCAARRRRETEMHVQPTASQLAAWMSMDHAEFAAIEQRHQQQMNQRKKALDSAVEQLRKLKQGQDGT